MAGRILTVLSGIAFAGLVLAAALGAWHYAYPEAFPPFNDRSLPGCYWTSAMITFIECRGFSGAGFATYILMLPFNLFYYIPTFALYSLFNHPLLLLHPWYLHLVWLGLGLLFPFIVLVRLVAWSVGR